MDWPFTFPGEFPECGCHYTTDDDGVHFCRIHKAAPELLAACNAAKSYLEPDLVEPGRIVFWALVEAIKKAEGRI